MIHYVTNDRLTACGASTDYAVHTDEPELVAGCQECIIAAAAVPAEACPGVQLLSRWLQRWAGRGDRSAAQEGVVMLAADRFPGNAAQPATQPATQGLQPAPAGQPPRQADPDGAAVQRIGIIPPYAEAHVGAGGAHERS